MIVLEISTSPSICNNLTVKFSPQAHCTFKGASARQTLSHFDAGALFSTHALHLLCSCFDIRCVNCGLTCFQTQNMMYDLLTELQHRREDLDRRIVALEEKLDSVLLCVQSLPVVLSQAITKLQRDFLDELACRVHFLSSSLSPECCSVPARQLYAGPSTPETPCRL